MSLLLLWPGSGDSQAIVNPPAAPPAAPVVTATPADSQVTLTWPAVPTATAYQPYVNGSAYGTQTAAISVRITALSDGTSYTFTVIAVNGFGPGPASSPVIATPTASGSLPAAPVLDTVTPGNTTATLAWEPVANTTFYQPQVNGANSGGTVTDTFVTLTGLTNGTGYLFGVKAGNSHGLSPASNTITATPSGTTITPQPAAWSDLAADVPGANLHTPFTGWIYKQQGPYSSPAVAIKTSLDYAMIRHVRDNISINSASQRSTLATICADGIDVLFSCGDLTSGSYATLNAQIPSIVSDVQNHYSGVTVALQGLNESNAKNPNTGGAKSATWAADTRSYQQNLWNAAHPVGITVYSPPLADGASAPAALGSVDAWCDWNSMHEYPGGQKPSTNIAAKISASSVNVSTAKPMTFDETGYNTAIHAASGNSPVTEAVQAEYVVILILEMYRQGVKRAYLYEMGDDREDDTLTNTEKHFGHVVAWDAQPTPSYRFKPAATALRNMQSLLVDPGTPYTPASLAIAVSGGDSGLRWLLFGKRDGSYVVCLWRDVSVYTPSATKDGGKPVTVSSQTITVQLGTSKTLTRYDFQSDGTAPGTSLGSVTSTAVSLAGALVLLTIA